MSLEGVAELPLHEGRVPSWLMKIMLRLAHAILRVMVDEFGPDRVVERFSNPLWFQGFNNVIGMDWDSSGSTTVTTGVLKTVTWRDPGLGLLVLGGKGSNARRVPDEAPVAVDLLGLDKPGSYYSRVSRLVAKIDSTMLQDNYTLYHHALFISNTGRWCIVQQGMNVESRMARRYHWLDNTSFYDNPHRSVSGRRERYVLNMVSTQAQGLRRAIIDLVREKPSSIVNDYSEIYRGYKSLYSIEEFILPSRTGVVKRGLDKIVYYKPLPTPRELLDKLRRIHSVYPDNMDELLLVKGVGPSVLRALALISDLIYNEPPSFKDPVDTPYDPFKYSYAIGGKDGVPYPVDRRVAEEVIYTLEDMIHRAKLRDRDRYRALKSLSKIKLRVLGKYLK